MWDIYILPLNTPLSPLTYYKRELNVRKVVKEELSKIIKVRYKSFSYLKLFVII